MPLWFTLNDDYLAFWLTIYICWLFRFTYTRLDAYYALQDLWQLKHLLILVPLIRTFNRYTFYPIFIIELLVPFHIMFQVFG